MSRYAYIKCKECDQQSEDINHGEAAFQAVIKVRDAIVAMDETLQGIPNIWIDFKVEISSRVNIAPFIVEHKGHTLEIWDEYGYQYDLETLERLP